MNNIIAVLTQNIVPIFIVAGFGYALQRWAGLNKQTLSRAVFYCLSPCLVFSSLVGTQLTGNELLGLAGFTVFNVLTMGVLGWVAAKVMRLGRTETVALLVMVMFVNGGNYGLTLNHLRYGDPGLARAVVFYTTSTVILYTFGIFLASTGQLTWRQALARLWRMPPIYAAVLAILVYSFQITLPTSLLRGIEVAGTGAIPVMLLVLGMQMADLQGRATLRLALPTITLRLLIAPLIAMGMALLLGLEGLGRSTSIIEASMPPAVFTIILATEFDLQPSAVTSIVVVATLLSPLTLAAMITFLGL
ncbi:MAG: AEC family transporter [Ardenticatenaceae bacterium]|nr:AEC family transporter [Anaerolineales bacterium]MCB8921945.1 AEC family transporter [Ardenticatenaceae bacterium]MCB8989521.1 AEC family transporter [Ardenticatenaceae bacterium]MCB9003064.1 AEC family transporter [Ardenticatenaceae bacterium]